MFVIFTLFQSCIKQLVRDWSDNGAAERESCYQRNGIVSYFSVFNHWLKLVNKASKMYKIIAFSTNLNLRNGNFSSLRSSVKVV